MAGHIRLSTGTALSLLIQAVLVNRAEPEKNSTMSKSLGMSMILRMMLSEVHPRS